MCAMSTEPVDAHDRRTPTRLNREPIFVNGFGRGGTSLLMNMLLSHPRVCMATGETHKVFKGGELGSSFLGSLRKKLRYDWPLRIAARQDVLRNTLLEPRHVPAFMDSFIDRVFYREKLRARHESHNLWREEGVEYRPEEIAASRLVTKTLNGSVHMSDVFHRIYPDAVFLGLVRNGFAVAEGMTRRGTDAEWFGTMFDNIATKMLELDARWENYHLLRFERLLEDPRAAMEEIHAKAGLDFSEVKKVRFQAKEVSTAEGGRKLEGDYDRQVLWYDVADMAKHVSPDIDRIQIERLDPARRERFLSRAGPVMERLGYV